MNISKYLLFITIAILGFASANAQVGASGTEGAYLNYNDYVNSPRAIGGDYEIDTKGYLEIGVNGVLDVIGAITNKGTILLDSGAVLSVFGNMLNEGTFILKKGAKVNFYGETWKNTTGASVIDGAGVNTVPGGELVIDVDRPNVSASWLTLSPYLLDYSGENTTQYIDGGNVAMDVMLHLHNQKNIELINTPTRIEGQVHWMADHSHLIIGNNDMVFTKNATQSGYNTKNYIVTNGSGHVVKENFSGSWIFPVGKAEDDYTPAVINNTTPNTMHVAVQDYATSASVENTLLSAQDGMDRTWNIYADVAVGVSSIALQHNTSTNLPAFSEDFNFVTRWSNNTPNLTGDMVSVTAWQLNHSIASSIGSVTGSSTNSRTFSNFATNPTDSTAYYTKSSVAFSEPAVQMSTFKVDSMRCEASIKFTTTKENRISKFQLQHSVDGITYSTISTFAPKGDNSEYEFLHATPISGKNYYRIVFVEPSGDYKVSDIVTTTVKCDENEPVLVLYPNPARDYINISGLVGNYEIRIINMNGRVVSAVSTSNSTENIDISILPAASYIVQAMSSTQKVTNIKFIKY
jgi:hypothetical protein